MFTDDLLLNALAFGSVLSLSYALERLERMLAAAIDGDPTTTAEPAQEQSPSASASASPAP